MKLRRTCQDVTRLVLESQDRPLAVLEQVSLRLHWLACGGCRRFRQQQQLMQQAMARWRQYRDVDADPAAEVGTPVRDDSVGPPADGSSSGQAGR